MERLAGFAIAQWRLTLTLIALILLGGAFTYPRQPS
jgi:hypothetical protein